MRTVVLFPLLKYERSRVSPFLPPFFLFHLIQPMSRHLFGRDDALAGITGASGGHCIIEGPGKGIDEGNFRLDGEESWARGFNKFGHGSLWSGFRSSKGMGTGLF